VTPETDAQLRSTLKAIEYLVDELAKILAAVRPKLEADAKRYGAYRS